MIACPVVDVVMVRLLVEVAAVVWRVVMALDEVAELA